MNIEAATDPTIRIRASACPANIGSGLQELGVLADRAATLNEALDRLETLAVKDARRPVRRLKDRLAAFEPSITVLGQVKSGKTTLINAMAGWADLLPSDVNPWTSVVTSLHLSPAEERAETGARFQFLTEAEWERLTRKGGRLGELAGRAGADSELQKIREQLRAMQEKSRKRLGRHFELLMGQQHSYDYFDKNLLERYICLGDDFDPRCSAAGNIEQGRFADITRSADLFLNCRTVPFRMCLRDTPGVNDTFMMREMVTIRAVRDSRICVVVLSAGQALSSVDMALIRLILNLDSREVIIFVNRVDELPDPARQMVEIEDSIRATLRAKDGPADARIIFGSAYWAGKVLGGELDSMHPASADSLLSITQAVLGTTETDLAPADLVWAMSGLPSLMAALSAEVVDRLGSPCLKKIAASAVAIATSQQAAGAIAIVPDGAAAPGLSGAELKTEFEKLSARHIAALEREIDTVLADYRKRADRAQSNFVERATHSLLVHLERIGDAHVWEYDPAGLRVLLRSAYSLMSSRVRKAALGRYEAAVGETAGLLYRGFGTAVEGIQMALPDVPQAPPPVALGQTIALDFNDSWWAVWWRRTRGYKAFAKCFQKLIRAETEDFMTQMKDVQTSDHRASLVAELRGFFEQQQDILSGLIAGAERGADFDGHLAEQPANRRHDELEQTLQTLRSFAE